MNVEKVDFIGLQTQDVERSKRFYVETLGFEKRADVPFGNGYRWVEVAPAGAPVAVTIRQA